MYNPAVTDAQLAALIPTVGFTPTRHSWSECDQLIRHLNLAVDIDDRGRVARNRDLTQEEVEWIRNERLLCRYDFHYFSTRYCRIKDPFDQVVPFSPWKSQRIFLDILSEMEEQRIALMLIVLKARQLGVSRLAGLLILHRICFNPHVNAIMGSSTPAKTLKLLDMLEFCLDRLPWWLVPSTTARRRDGEGGFVEFGNMDTGLTLQHGSMMTGIARGTTPTIGHLTEMAEFVDPSSLVDSALLRAMHDSPRTMLILEGTAEGQFNWWHDKWQSAVEGWPERKSRLRPVFLPWFVGRDIYPTEAWVRAHPVPDPYSPQPWVTDHARRAEEYVRSNYLLSRHLGSGWRMPREQMWFYEVERGQAIRENRLNQFLQEMPASDDEAFQSTNISVFSTEVVTAHRDQCRTPVGVYGLRGPTDLLHPRFQPHPVWVNPDQPPISITYSWSTPPINFQLIPLRWDGFPTDSGNDKIYIWEHPQPGQIYGLGVDVAEGIQKDRSCIEVMRKGSIYSAASQAAEFCSPSLNALDLTPFGMALAAYYSTERPDNDRDFIKQCRVAIECRSSGDQMQLKMKLHGWSNFHPWQRIDGKRTDPSQFNKIGVFTNVWFRASLMEYLIKMLRDMELEILSPFFVREMQSLEADEMRQSLKAARGAHDDRIMAMGFILISLYQWEKGRSSIQAPVIQESSRSGSYAIYTPSPQEVLDVL